MINILCIQCGKKPIENCSHCLWIKKQKISTSKSRPHYNSLEERFWSKVKRGENCWEWIGYKNKTGYGRFAIKGYAQQAHRISWIIKNGKIPKGLCVLHKCDNPPCVNPNHLFIGTYKDNTQDALLKGRVKTPDSKLKLNEVKEIKYGSASIKEKINKFNVTRKTINDIIKLRTWKSV